MFDFRLRRALLVPVLFLGLAATSGAASAQPPADPPLGFAIEATAGDVRLIDRANTASFTSCSDGVSLGERGSIQAAGAIDVAKTAVVRGELFPKTRSSAVPLPPPADLVPGGDLVVGPGQTLTLAAGDYLVDDVKLYDTATLLGAGAVRLFVRGTLNLGPKSRFAAETQRALDFRIFVQSGKEAIRFESDSKALGVLYAPDRQVTLDPRASLVGALVGAEVELQDAAAVLFDEALEDGCGPPPDSTAPEISFSSPLPGLFLTQEQPELVVRYADFDGEGEEPATGVDPASLSFTVDGAPLATNCEAGVAVARCTPGALLDGDRVIGASVRDFAGNAASATVEVIVDATGVDVAITDPAAGLLTAAETIEITGTVGPGVVSVEVNGVAAALGGGAFQAIAPLREGTNLLTAVATKASGLTGSAALEVTRDAAPPLLRITAPRAGQILVSPRLAVAGLVSDAVSGGVEPRVTVDGIEAEVVDGTFVVPGVELLPGPNTLEAVATDAAGNKTRATVDVFFQRPVGARIEIADGDTQSAPVNADLPQPLEVVVLDDLDNPVAGRPVRFEVTRNSGLLRPIGDGEPRRVLEVPSDGAGRARALFTLGDTAGAGNNRVKVSAVGAAGEAEFCATATSGAPAQILAVDGFSQTGQVEQPLARPLEVRLIDDDGNPVAQTAVSFVVTAGAGGFRPASDPAAPLSAMTDLLTDADGYARATFHLGATPGVANHTVEARFGALDAAVFSASALSPGDPAATVFAGAVLDNAQTPIPGTRVVVEAFDGGGAVEVVTDEAGRFRAEGVVPGAVRLRVDPTASPRPESFPPILFEALAIAGRENTLGRPILLPPIDAESSKIVGGDEDVILTMRGVVGFSITVFAGSATFPDGSTVGPMSVSQIQLDKVPMAPPTGSIFMPPAWTIQPAGVRFDPPARVTIPNDGLAPGRVIEIFQLDPAIEDFIVVGQGVVSEDGAVIVGDEGFGIERSGWGGCGLPPLPGTDMQSGDEGDSRCPSSDDDLLPIDGVPPIASRACSRIAPLRASNCRIIFGSNCQASCINACTPDTGAIEACGLRCSVELARCTASVKGCKDAIKDLKKKK